MLRILSRVQLAYLGLGVAACLGLFVYQATQVWPVRRCEAHGGWWSAKYHMCAQPMPVWRFTGRKPATAAPTPRP